MGAKFSGSLEKNYQEVLELEKPAAVDQVVSEVKEAPNLTTLVVPVFIHNGRDYWFDDDNPWLNIWQKHKLGNKFVLPMVDLEDLTIINKNILNKNLIDLASLFEKYGVNNIALYTVEDIENGSNHNLTLKVNYINKYHYSWQAYHFADIIGADINQLLEKAYSETQSFKFNSNLDACCKIANDLNTLPPQKLMVDFPVDKISDWLQLQHILKGISYVSEVNLEKFTAKNYYFSCMSSISVEDLKGLLLKYNLKLEEQGDEFVLTKVEAVEEFRNTASVENANNGFDLD